KRNWRRRYREAELRYGSGFIGLLPRYQNCGGAKLAPEVRALIHQVLSTHYNTTTRKPKRGAYGEYLKQCEEQHLPPTTQRTFYDSLGPSAHCSLRAHLRSAQLPFVSHGPPPLRQTVRTPANGHYCRWRARI